MTSYYREFFRCMEELTNIDKSGCQIVYSEITKSQFEKYCNKHLLCCKGTVMCDYKESIVSQNIFQIACFSTLFFVGTRLLECGDYACGWMRIDWVMTGLLAAVCLCASRLITVNIKSKLFSSNEEIERQIKYQKYVEENYYPLLELQEVMKKNTVSSIHIKTIDSLIEVKYYDKAGQIRSQSAYFKGRNVEYDQDGKLDFSGIDDMIIKMAGEFGLNPSIDNM